MEVDLSVGYGAGVAFSYSDGYPSYATLALNAGTGGGADVDITHRCYAYVSPTAKDLLSAATCSSVDAEVGSTLSIK